MIVPPSTLQIGLIASAKQTSGSDRYFFELIRNLRGLGGSVDGVVLGDPQAVEDPQRNVEGFAPEGSGALRRWSGLRRAVRLRTAANDVVVSHLAAHVFPALDLIWSRPLVEHFHGPWALEARYSRLPGRTVALRYVQESAVYRRAQRIVVLSHSFAQVLQREYRVPEQKIKVIPGGVDLARFSTDLSRAEARSRLGLPTDRPIIACVRRLESTKGIDVLIEAATQVTALHPDALIVIAGTGRLRYSLAKQVRERGLESNVQFVGKIDDAKLLLLYRSCDFSVVPSQAWEGFGLVCIESLASGTPVLVTPTGGLPEAVRDLDPALVFAGHDATAIASGLCDALSGGLPLPDEAACYRYAQRFAWPAIAARIAEVYREVA